MYRYMALAFFTEFITMAMTGCSPTGLADLSLWTFS